MKLLKNLLLSALMLWGGVCATYAQEKTMTAGVPVVKLNNGVEMPRFGLGTFLQPSDEVCEQSCLTALKADYRHIDTAHAYQDEAGVGHAVKESGNKEDSRSPRQDPGAGHPALAHPGSFSVIPGASNPDYIKENIQIFDFQLTDDEMQQMRSLNKEKRFFNATLEDVEKMVWGARL